MTQTCKCVQCGREYKVGKGFFHSLWQNTELCKECFDKGIIPPKSEKKSTQYISVKASKQQTIVKLYTGNQKQATAAFQKDAPGMEAKGYFPISQTWAPGSYGCKAFILALILCFILIGIIVFIYMIIVKPAGTLTVTYKLRKLPEFSKESTASEERTCPKCAETIKAAAFVCRFCGHKFD